MCTYLVFSAYLISIEEMTQETSVTKNCAGARTVPALYGCGPHSNLIFKGHWTLILGKKFEKKNFPCFFTFLQSIQKIIAFLNHIYFRTLFLCINLGAGVSTGTPRNTHRIRT